MQVLAGINPTRLLSTELDSHNLIFWIVTFTSVVILKQGYAYNFYDAMIFISFAQTFLVRYIHSNVCFLDYVLLQLHVFIA